MDTPLRAAGAGDPAVKTFVCHERSVRQYFLRRLHRSREDAADLTQEVGLRFLSLRPAFWPDDPRRYLFGIARHVLAEHLEHRARQCRLAKELLAEEASTVEPSSMFRDPAESVAAIQLSNFLLNKLPRRQREVLKAQAQSGYSYMEVATRLGLAVTTVEKDLALAKTHLRALVSR